jgi:hypothetical protein
MVQGFSGERKSLFELWDMGAKELEKTVLGKLITAPVRVPSAVINATEKTVAQAPKIAGSVPLVLIILAVGIGGYLLLAGKQGVKLTP